MMKTWVFIKIYLSFLFIIILNVDNANAINGLWTMDSKANFDFSETNFCASERDTTNNGNIIEYRYEGPYEIRGDTIVWFNKYQLEVNLSSKTTDTFLVNESKVENRDTFFLGINLNGPSVKIANQQWFGSNPMLIDSSLIIGSFGNTGLIPMNYSNFSGLSGDSMSMIQSAIENSPEDDGISLSIKIPDDLRHYRLYIWFCRPDTITNKPGEFRFSAYESNIYDGVPNVDTVLTNVGDWVRFGPYHVDASSYLNIHAMAEGSINGNRKVSVSGLELHKGPSIKNLNTYRYLYKIKNDSLYMVPVEEELFGSVSLCKVNSTRNLNKSNRNNLYFVKDKQQTSIYNILGRKINVINYKGLYLVYKNEQRKVLKEINVKKYTREE